MEPNKRLLKEPQSTSAVWPDSHTEGGLNRSTRGQRHSQQFLGVQCQEKDLLSPLHTSTYLTAPGNPDVKLQGKSLSGWPWLPSYFEETAGVGKGML